jgi:L-fucose isomerase
MDMADVRHMRVDPPQNRLAGQMPKIGIRPTIDGRRRGVREALEGPTMGLAKAVAGRLQKELRHANGLPVECVIADTCIGGVAEAAQTAEKFARAGVGLSACIGPQWA